MAVVFVSPKTRQRNFLTIVVSGFLGLLALIFLWVFFFSSPGADQISVGFNKPKVTVNTSVFDSDQFKQLQPFDPIPLQFSYRAQTISGKLRGKTVTGVISAASEDDARKMLQDNGLSVGQLTLLVPGRDNPFTPYSPTSGTSQ